MVNFFLRKVKYPLLIQSDTVVVGACNTRQFDRLVEKYSFKTSVSFDVVDATGEGWSYYPESNSLSPLTVNKIWSKNRIINFYNASVKDQCPERLYVARSLSNKRLSVIVEEVVELANKSAVA